MSLEDELWEKVDALREQLKEEKKRTESAIFSLTSERDELATGYEALGQLVCGISFDRGAHNEHMLTYALCVGCNVEVPRSVLLEHIETCEKHPMAALKAELRSMEALRAAAVTQGSEFLERNAMLRAQLTAQEGGTKAAAITAGWLPPVEVQKLRNQLAKAEGGTAVERCPKHDAATLVDTITGRRERRVCPQCADEEYEQLRDQLGATRNELFDLRNKAGCGPEQSGPDVWAQLALAKANIVSLTARFEGFKEGVEEGKKYTALTVEKPQPACGGCGVCTPCARRAASKEDAESLAECSCGVRARAMAFIVHVDDCTVHRAERDGK